MPDSYYTNNSDLGITQNVKPSGIAITQADLDAGLSPEQIQWLLSNLNVKALYTALRNLPDAQDAGRDVQDGSA